MARYENYEADRFCGHCRKVTRHWVADEDSEWEGYSGPQGSQTCQTCRWTKKHSEDDYHPPAKPIPVTKRTDDGDDAGTP